MKKTLTLLPLALLLLATIVGCKKEDKDLDAKTPTGTTKKTIPELLTAGKTVQFILNEGYTPKEIYDNDTNYIDSLYGKNYQAGIIFYFRTDGTGFVAAPTDHSVRLTWGCDSTDLPGASSSQIGSGKQNTIDILAGCSDPSIAAKVCDDMTLGGYSDWFLPSYNELKAMDLRGYVTLQRSTYWSSTESSDVKVQAFNFATGRTSFSTKGNSFYVRAVREF